MTAHFARLITLCIFLFGPPAFAASAATDVPPVPANIEVPAGHSLFFQGYAIGTQNFICLATSTGLKWTFTGPQATLFLTQNGQVVQQLTTHFLSVNPGKNRLPRPTWQHSLDTSSVWGRVLASSADAAFVAPGAIPWLLLEVVASQRGPAGGDILTRSTFIHRLNTGGGVAPTTGCGQSTDVGAVALVPYTADYYFYKANR